MRVTCEGCGAKLNAGEEMLGKSVACPKCRQTIQLPDPTPSDIDEPDRAADDDDELPAWWPSFYWGIECVFGWLSLCGYLLDAVLSGESQSEGPSAAWLITILAAIAVGRLDAIHRQLKHRR